MRIDERAAEALQDSDDLRGLLLIAASGELRHLAELSEMPPGSAPDMIAIAIERQIAKELPDRAEEPLLLMLARWAAARLGGGAEYRTLADADAAVLGAVRPVRDQPRLLQIAVAIAQLRQNTMRRLGRWRPLLDLLLGKGDKSAGAPEVRTGHRSRKIRDEAGEAGLDETAVWDMIKGAGSRLPLSVWEERLTQARKSLGRFNIIVAGRTGVGKTTLIGAIFGREVGDTLMGRPRTRGRIWYPLEPTDADVLRLCDTEGLELERYQETLGGLKREVENRNASNDPFDHIHVAWLCIDEPSLTVQPGEEALVKMLTQEGIPVIVVLTKAGMAPAFKATIDKLLPAAKAVVRVRAKPIEMEGQSFAQMGLDELMQATERTIPSAVSAAWHVASRNLQANLRRCEGLVKRAAAAAGAAGAAPIPLADAAGVFGIQVGMIVAISLNMGVKLRRSDLQAMAVTLIGALGVTAGGRFIAGQVAKLVPGLGSIVGSAITGTTAAALTYGLGHAYLEYLRRFYAEHERMPDPTELVTGFRSFWRQWKNKYEAPPGAGGTDAP
jgi:uncharacterized protein (DUF697 family)